MTDAFSSLWPSQYNSRWDGVSIDKRHWHFYRALLERYGIVLAAGEFSDILRDFGHGARFYLVSDGTDVFTAWPASKKLNGIRREVVRGSP